MMRLFTPRKSTLLFVIRDKTKVCIALPFGPIFGISKFSHPVNTTSFLKRFLRLLIVITYYVLCGSDSSGSTRAHSAGGCAESESLFWVLKSLFKGLICLFLLDLVCVCRFGILFQSLQSMLPLQSVNFLLWASILHCLEDLMSGFSAPIQRWCYWYVCVRLKLLLCLAMKKRKNNFWNRQAFKLMGPQYKTFLYDLQALKHLVKWHRFQIYDNASWIRSHQVVLLETEGLSYLGLVSLSAHKRFGKW